MQPASQERVNKSKILPSWVPTSRVSSYPLLAIQHCCLSPNNLTYKRAPDHPPTRRPIHSCSSFIFPSSLLEKKVFFSILRLPTADWPPETPTRLPSTSAPTSLLLICLYCYYIICKSLLFGLPQSSRSLRRSCSADC